MKPLKAPKKDKKDLDPEDLAFKEKQKAGRFRANASCCCSMSIF